MSSRKGELGPLRRKGEKKGCTIFLEREADAWYAWKLSILNEVFSGDGVRKSSSKEGKEGRDIFNLGEKKKGGGVRRTIERREK